MDSDGKALVSDVQCSILATLWSLGGQTDSVPPCIKAPGSPGLVPDFNCDHVINISDTLLGIGFVLGITLNPSMDADGDQCVDACQTDIDGDGDFDFSDCAPQDPDVGKEALELCNGFDDNCNGTIDEQNAATVNATCDDQDPCNGVESCPLFAGSGLIISEIALQPNGSEAGSAGQWFELTNLGNAAVNVRGWVITDESDDLHVIDPGGALFVPAGGYLVLGSTDNVATNGGAVVGYVFNNFTLASSDKIVLLNKAGAEVDRVEYAAGEFPMVPGKTTALGDLLGDNNSASNWVVSSAPYGVNGNSGTPGGPNSDVLPSACLPGVNPVDCGKGCSGGGNIVDGVWASFPEIGWGGRDGVTAVVMPNGALFVHGGQVGFGNLSKETRVVDVSNGTSSQKKASFFPHYVGTAYVLPDGSVVVVGGLGASEIWHPEDYWTTPANPPAQYTRAVQLLDGRIIAIGGAPEGGGWTDAVAGVWMLDPKAPGAWTALKSMPQPRSTHGIAVMADGRIMVAGGVRAGNPYSNSVEIYDPKTDSWWEAASMKFGRHGANLAVLPSGKVLSFGGSMPGTSAAWVECQVYDPGINSWTDVGPMHIGRVTPGALQGWVITDDGHVMVVGGSYAGWTSLKQCEYFDETDNVWHLANPMTTYRAGHAVVKTPQNSILAIQGYDPKDGVPGSGSMHTSNEILECP
ncbi:MAG: lamin tail domain-containing protein [Myxococcales bacterium]|nr:lamin tail domain-containing protein [Myxococcales bacterium]